MEHVCSPRVLAAYLGAALKHNVVRIVDYVSAMLISWLGEMERKMAQKEKNAAAGGFGRKLPAEVYEYHDDVNADVVRAIRDERGVDVNSGGWRVIDSLGQVVSA
jgi:hypothetical protein